MSDTEAQAHFLRCCGSRAWAEAMTAARPYDSIAAVHARADSVWASLERPDWLEAFKAHPRIGDIESLRKKFADTRQWAAGEQSGADGASAQVLQSLAEGNETYEQKFGHLFIVCATGKTADEMRSLLEARLANDPDEELRIAAREQLKITQLRIDKWLASEGSMA